MEPGTEIESATVARASKQKEAKLMRLRAALRRVWHIIQTQWILVNLFIAVLIAILAPAPGIAVVSVEAGPFRLFQLIPILIVFLIAGATLATKEIAAGLKHWPGVVFGFVSILGVTPCLGFALAALPVSPPEFPAGLAIFAAAPTTLGVGAALVRSCHGNDSLATFLMIGTSILSVFTIPFWLKALLGTLEISGIETVAIDIGQMLWRLVATVLAPATVGKLLREFCPPVRAFVTRWKVLLGMLSVSCLAFIVWQTLSGAQEQLLEQDGLSVLYVILAAIIQHGIYLVFNAIIVYFIARMPPKEAVAVIVMASQKSAPVAVTAITFLTNDIAVQGLLSLPCIVGQLAQVFSGAVLAPFIATRVDSALKGVDSGLGDQQKKSVAVDAAAQLNGSGKVDAVV